MFFKKAVSFCLTLLLLLPIPNTEKIKINQSDLNHLSPLSKLNPPLIIIVGGGASGFYAAEQLIQQGNQVLLINEDAPIGGGTRFLIRPDKIKLKQGLLKRFVSTLKSPLFKGYYGGLKVAQNSPITLDDLAQLNPSMIYLAAGSRGNKQPNLPGIESKQIYDAYQIAQIYNLSPGFKQLPLNLYGHVGILGVGNVTADMIVWMAFINRLIQSFQTLEKEKVSIFDLEAVFKEKSPQKQFSKFTDNFYFILKVLHELNFVELDSSELSVKALPKLYNSQTTEVSVFARRGPFEFKMNPKEVQEIMPFINFEQFKKEIRRNLATIYQDPVLMAHYNLNGSLEEDLRLVLKNIIRPTLLNKIEQGTFNFDSSNLNLSFRFLTQPKKFISDDTRTLSQVQLALNRLSFDEKRESVNSVSVSSATLPLNTFIYSIGSNVSEDLGIQLDRGWPEVDPEDPFQINYYSTPLNREIPLRVSGWNRRPSSGLAGSANGDAKIATKEIQIPPSQLSSDEFEAFLNRKGLTWISKDDILKVHEYELTHTKLLTQVEFMQHLNLILTEETTLLNSSI